MEYGFLFLVAGAVVVAAGTALAKYADAIAARTGMGRLWIGAVLLAGANSLPELGTEVSAVRLGAPELALGDLFGSTMANMLILGLVDLMHRRREVLRRATLDHALAAALAVGLNGLAVIFVLAPTGLVFAGVSPEALLIFGAYLLSTRSVYRNAMRDFGPALAPGADAGAAAEQVPSLRRAVTGFAIAALVILAVTPAFAYSATRLAAITGLGTTFLGAWLVGFCSSLPELVSSVAAVRMGAFDLAVGNLFGSNALKPALLLAQDLALPAGSIFEAANRTHALTGLFGVVLMALGLSAIVFRAERRFRLIEPDSALILFTYALGVWVLYVNR